MRSQYQALGACLFCDQFAASRRAYWGFDPVRDIAKKLIASVRTIGLVAARVSVHCVAFSMGRACLARETQDGCSLATNRRLNPRRDVMLLHV